jgi:hypothetical protein
MSRVRGLLRQQSPLRLRPKACLSSFSPSVFCLRCIAVLALGARTGQCAPCGQISQPPIQQGRSPRPTTRQVTLAPISARPTETCSIACARTPQRAALSPIPTSRRAWPPLLEGEDALPVVLYPAVLVRRVVKRLSKGADLGVGEALCRAVGVPSFAGGSVAEDHLIASSRLSTMVCTACGGESGGIQGYRENGRHDARRMSPISVAMRVRWGRDGPNVNREDRLGEVPALRHTGCVNDDSNGPLAQLLTPSRPRRTRRDQIATEHHNRLFHSMAGIARPNSAASRRQGEPVEDTQ